jgi:hypothetical protein
MGKPLENILEQVADWPEAAQEALMQSIAEIEEKFLGPYALSDEERLGIEKGLEDARNKRFASPEKVAAVFNKYRG